MQSTSLRIVAFRLKPTDELSRCIMLKPAFLHSFIFSHRNLIVVLTYFVVYTALEGDVQASTV